MRARCLGLLLALLAGPVAHAETFADWGPPAVAQWQALLPGTPAGIGPACSDRAAWSAPEVAQRSRSVLRAADALLDQPFPAWRDADYLEYAQQGTRPAGERMMNARKAWLYPLVLAECVQWQGRYLGAIAQVLGELNTQATWTWPAHDKGLRNFRAHDYEVDLLAADTAHDVAHSLYLLGDALPAPLRQQTRATLEARIFAPVRRSLLSGGKDHWWLHADHNWNAVCLKGVVGAALTVLPARQDRALFAAAGAHFIQNYIAGFGDDGYALEGPGYWNYGFSHFTLLRELLYQGSGGAVDLMDAPKVRRIARYGFGIEMLPGVIAAFGDAPRNVKPDATTLAYAHAVYGLGTVPGLAELAVDARQSGNAAPLVEASLKLFGQVAPVAQAEAPLAQPLHTYFEQAGVLVSRPADGQKLAVSIKAGGNGNHSHNDIGSYSIGLGAEQPSGDPGATVYSAKTFGPERYRIKGIGSFGHPVPLVADQVQRVATTVQPRVLRTQFSTQEDSIQIDLASAYAVPGLQTLTRSLWHDRRGLGSVTVEDRFAFGSPHSFETAVIALGPWQLRPDGQIELWQKSEHLLAQIQASAPYSVVDEAVDEEGLRFTRLALRLNGAVQQGFVRVRFEPLAGPRSAN